MTRRVISIVGFGSPGTGWRARLLGAVLTLIAIAVGVFVIVVSVPLILIGAAAGAMIYGAARVRAWFRGVRSPNGWMDGRKNVRVITERSE